MESGFITGYIDVAQLVLYAFWLFFAALIIYLRREDKREGYPLESDAQRSVRVQGFPAVPTPKLFRLSDGGARQAPRPEPPEAVQAQPAADWPGAPLQPIGDAMSAAVGPGAYAERDDEPDLTFHGEPKIVPLRAASDFRVERRDPDPRGMSVIDARQRPAGKVVDVWVDREEPMARYLEMEVSATGRRALLPMGFARIGGRQRVVQVRTLLAEQFAGIPELRLPERVTRLEEDRIMAYFAGGSLYATQARQEPLV